VTPVRASRHHRYPFRRALTQLGRLTALAATAAGVSSVIGAGAAEAAGAAGGAVDTVRTVVDAATRTGTLSAAVSFRLVAARVFGPAPTPVTGSGAFDFSAGRGRVELHKSNGTETVVFLTESIFVHQAGTARLLPPGKTWISAGLTEAALSTNFPQFVVQSEGLNPVFLLREVAWGAAAATPVGPIVQGGSRADGYAVSVDLQRAAQAANGPVAAAYAKAIGLQLSALGTGTAAPTGAGVATVHVRIWIDAGGRVVRLQASPPGAGVGTTTMSLSSFGAAVRAAAPKSAKVADIASLSPGGERENNGGGDSDGA
jgi:hypothetical protein